MGKRTKSFQTIGFGLCAISMLMGVEMQATDWIVNTDSGGNTREDTYVGSLIYCLTNAVAGDTINVDANVAYITLLQSLPHITQGNLTITAPQGVIVNGNSQYVNLYVAASNVHVSNFIFTNGSGNQISLNSGSLTLEGGSSAYGNVSISGGTLYLAGTSSFPDSTLSMTGGAFDISQTSGASVGTLSGTSPSAVINVGSELLTINQQGNTKFEGSIQGTGGIDLTGGSQLTLHGNIASINSLTISNGILTFSYNGGLSNAPSTTIGASGSLWVEQPNATLNIGSVSGSGDIKVWPNSNALQITQAVEGTFSGKFTSDGSSAGEVSMVLNAPLNLTGNSSSFYGNINVLSGNLNLSGAGNFNSSVPINISTGAILNIATNSPVSIASLLGSGDINLTSGGLVVNQTQANIFSGNILGVANFTLQGSSTLTLSGDSSSYTGLITVNSGTLEISGVGALGSTTPVDIGASGVFSVNRSSGTLNIGSLSGSGNLNVISAIQINQSEEKTFSGEFTGSGNVSMSLSAPLTLTGSSSSFAGSLSALNGNLNLSGAGNFNGAVGLNLSSANLNVDTTSAVSIGSVQGSGMINLSSGGLVINQTSSEEFSGVFKGNAGFTLNGGSTLTLSGNSSLYTGLVSINNGTLLMSGSGNLNEDVSVDIGASGIFSVQSSSAVSIGSLSGSGILGLVSAGVVVHQSVPSTFSGIFTGAEGISLTGGDTLTLTGSSSGYTGSVSVDHATLLLSGSGNLNNASGISLGSSGVLNIDVSTSVDLQQLSGVEGSTIALTAGALNLMSAAAQTYSGQITNSGNLNLVGGGAFSLTASQDSFLGTIDITPNGQLNLTSEGALPSTVSLIVDGTLDISGITADQTSVKNLSGSDTGAVISLGSKALSITQAVNQTYQGAITGAGGIKKSGSANLVLAGSLTYTGPTEVYGGSLILSGASTLASSASVTLAGGSVSISSAAAAVTFNNFSGQSTSSVELGGQSLTLHNTQNLSYSGAINGSSGTITKTGQGELSLLGVGTYQGGTFLSEGSLNIGNSSALGVGVFSLDDSTSATLQSNINLLNDLVFLNGVVTFSVGDVSTLSGNSDGAGSFTKVGSGMLVILGDFVNIGVNQISAGEVKVVGAVNSGFEVVRGATLSGCGNVGDVTLSGQLRPGCSSTQIVVNGNLSLLPGSTVTIQVDGSSNGSILNNGTTTIGSSTSLFFDIQSGYKDPLNTFEFLSADQINGAFTSITTSSAFFSANVFQSGSQLLATISMTSNLQVPSDRNASHIGAAISNLYQQQDPSIYPIYDDLLALPTQEDVDMALEQMNLSYYKGLAVQQEVSAVLVQDAIKYRIEQLVASTYCYTLKPYAESLDNCGLENGLINIWVDGFGDFLHQGNNRYAGSPQTGYNNATGGVVLGADACFAEYFTGGVIAAYSGSSLDWNSSRAHGDINSAYAGVYLSAVTDYVYATASVVGSWSNYYTKRKIEFPGVYEKASSSRGGDQVSSQLNVGGVLNFFGIQFRPFNSFEYISQTENSFTETGAGAYDLSVRKNNSILIRNELGLQLGNCLCFLGGSWILAPQISWVREVRVKGQNYKARFAGTPETFVLTGYFPDRNLVSPGFFMSKMFWENRISVDLYYKGEFASKYASNSFGAQFRIGF